MNSAVVLFPGINRERDMVKALSDVCGKAPSIIWHTESDIPDTDLIVVPGGFSYGDYLRCGAIAARSPVMTALRRQVSRGTNILGVCNGFQILIEAGLLPGALMRNADLKFVCKHVRLSIENDSTFFTHRMTPGEVISCPVAHGDGNYFADPATLEKLTKDGRIVFRYAENTNPNGSIDNIAGIVNEAGNVIGMMPHPENMIESLHGATDCRPLFESLLEAA